MVKVLFALAKYLAWCNHLGRGCVAILTHVLQTSTFNQVHVLVASNSISLFCLEGRIYKISLLNPLPVLKLRWRYSGRCCRSQAHSACLVSQKLRPNLSKRIPCYTADCFKSSCLLFVDKMSYIWMCLVLQRDSRFVSRNCHATDIALTGQLVSNGFNHLRW